MGHYLNPRSRKFEMALNSEIYVDKSELIAKTNAKVDTTRRFICISRPRRFGKTMGADLLAEYYGRGEDVNHLFKNLNIATNEFYEKHLNKYNVLMINMQTFLSQSNSIEEMLGLLTKTVIEEIISENPEVNYKRSDNFIHVMKDTHAQTQTAFVILIDEWDCPLRVHKNSIEAHKIT